MFETNNDIAVWLLNVANDMRKAKNDAELIDLPVSVPQDTDHCIIANAFNYGCSVDPGAGTITFSDINDVDTYFKVMNLERSNFLYQDDVYFENGQYYRIDDDDYVSEQVFEENEAPMTPELIEIAEEFDAGVILHDYNTLFVENKV